MSDEKAPPPADSPQSRQAWKPGCFVTAVAVTAGFVTIVTGAVKIIEFANSWSTKLTAEVSLARFSLPPSVLHEREKLRAAIENKDALEKAIDLSKCDPVHRGIIAREIAQYFRTFIPYEGIEQFSGPSNVWFADVKNNSASTCEAVTLTLPGAKSVGIEREGKKIEYADINEVIDLGDLKPKELVKVTGWAFFTVDEDKLKLVYKTGVGSVTVLKPVSSDWRFFAEQWDSCAVELFMVLFGLIGAGFIIRRIKGGGKAAPTQQ